MATHYVARELLALGHQVKQVPPAYAKPFRHGHKNDFRDAHVIAEGYIPTTPSTFSNGLRIGCSAMVADAASSRQLYLPQEWASDRARRHKAGVPEEIAFKTKPEIALDQLR